VSRVTLGLLMRLYKYRSLANFEFVLDIILKQRLHCSTYDSLNDPFEGLFVSLIGGQRKVHKSVESLFSSSVDKIRICSLSSSLSDVRLWSHYADGHKGVVFEIDFSESESRIHKVKYCEELPSFFYGTTFLTKMFNAHPYEVLSCKTKHWEYEAEYRIFHESEHFDISNRMKAVYLGTRITETHYNFLTKLIPDEIPIFSTKLNKEKIMVEPNEKVKR
jgi:hypothetical protein